MIILITGATGLLGNTLLHRFIEEDCKVILLARNKIKIDALLSSIDEKFSDSILLAREVDLQISESVMQVCKEIIGMNLIPDVIINNAAVNTPLGNSWDIEIDSWKSHFDLNFFAPVIINNYFIPFFIEKTFGHIFNISGGGATKPMPYFSPYSASKSALVRYTETLALELVDYGISVNAIAPGFLASGIHTESISKESKLPYSVSDAIKTDFNKGGFDPNLTFDIIWKIIKSKNNGFSGNLVSAIWDQIESDLLDPMSLSREKYKLRRIV